MAKINIEIDFPKEVFEFEDKVRKETINEFVTRLEGRYTRYTVNVERFREFQFEMHRLAEEMINEEKG